MKRIDVQEKQKKRVEQKKEYENLDHLSPDQKKERARQLSKK